MTFEEFQRLALNPPRKDEPTLFRVRIYLVNTRSIDEASGIDIDEKESLTAEEIEQRRVYYPTFNLNHYQEYFAQDLAQAETLVKEQAAEQAEQGDVVYCFVVDELPFGINVFREYVSSRIYDASGKLLDQSHYCTNYDIEHDDYCHFRGRTEEQLRFKEGDIVEVFNDYHERVEIAIVVNVPPSVEWCYRYGLRGVKLWGKYNPELGEEELTRKCFNEWYGLDFTDDSYTVINEPAEIHLSPDGKQELCWPHDHVNSLRIFKPHYPIPEELERQLKEYYQQYMSQISQ